MKRNKKAFTLIELVSVLVILAILALIVTPLVLNIIKKARVAADKRSIDVYGRSIELAIADYLLENGTFPTSIDQLTIEYTGDRVVCSTTQLNSDSSVYLAECTVNNRTVTGYAYGTDKSPTYQAYSIGDEIKYNGVDYYVIKNSGIKESSVTLLKAEPLTTEEVNQYGGVGTQNNHVNMYLTNNPNEAYYQAAYDLNGYGGMAYYSSSTCGQSGNSGCTNLYDDSDIKYVVDAWAEAKVTNGLKEARLITLNELTLLGYEYKEQGTDIYYVASLSTPEWAYISDYKYWTMSPFEDSAFKVWRVIPPGLYSNSEVQGNIVSYSYYQGFSTVRPVIVLLKSVLN